MKAEPEQDYGRRRNGKKFHTSDVIFHRRFKHTIVYLEQWMTQMKEDVEFYSEIAAKFDDRLYAERKTLSMHEKRRLEYALEQAHLSCARSVFWYAKLSRKHRVLKRRRG